ncbi:MAG: 4Fe-4S dicluster domain-containing protein [Kiritimatiellaceae bacterium]|nr:MAG: 4Fe-4S dicluster domain-containing protein [Kiritimatiellaceae bacterium]
MKSFFIEETCISCGACEPQCPEQAISQGDDQYIINAAHCTSCSLCLGHCPVEAIVPPGN